MTTLAPAPKIRRTILIPVPREDSRMKFSDLSKAFEKWQRFAEMSEHYITSCAFVGRQFGAYLTARRLEDDLRHFTAEHVQGYAVELKERKAKASTVTRYLSALSALAIFGMKQPRGRGYLLSEDPTRRFDWPQTQEPETHYLYDEELRAIMGLRLDAYMTLALDLLIETGLRATELCTASVGDLQTIGGERVLRVIVKGRRSRQRKISVPLSDGMWEAIQAALLAGGRVRDDDPILVGKDGRRLNRTQLGAMVARMGRQAGISRLRVHPHMFRHTLAVQAKLAKIDPRTTSALLNHTDPRSLRRYDHIVPGELHGARETVNAARVRRVMPLAPPAGESHDGTMEQS